MLAEVGLGDHVSGFGGVAGEDFDDVVSEGGEVFDGGGGAAGLGEGGEDVCFGHGGLVGGVDFGKLGGGVGCGGGGDYLERAECGAGLVAVQPVVQGAACGFVGAGVGCEGVCEDAEENQGDDGEGVFHGLFFAGGWCIV